MDEEYQQQAAAGLHDLDKIMQSFGVAAWRNLGPLESAPDEGLRVIVEIEGQRFVLRERSEGMLDEDLRHRYDFQRYLRQQGIPIPDYRRTPQGDLAVTLDEESFELQQWPGGETFSSADPRNLERVAFAGSMLGRIHRAARQYQGQAHRWPSEAHLGGIVQGYLNLARARAEQGPTAALATALSEWVERWEAVLPGAMISIGAARSLPEFHIHGDYHAHHLRFNDFGVTAVMGWDASRWEKRLFELATALFSFSALAWRPQSSGTAPLVKRGLDPDRARHFLRAYTELSPPVPGEAALLADALLLVAPIVSANGPLEDLFYGREGLESTTIDALLERLAWSASLPAWLGRVRRSLAEMWE